MARFSPLLIGAAALCLFSGCDRAEPEASAKTVTQYESHCSSCHEVGAANAPRRGDAHQWSKRLKKGEARLVASVKKGLVAMPPRGGCNDCNDEDFKALIRYMAAE